MNRLAIPAPELETRKSPDTFQGFAHGVATPLPLITGLAYVRPPP
ncbi:hypothetical protein SBA2_410010 [Acidobacteriia bacterium SbA2]|nr:hypothetical protein SBA2_410010 [Acidobacteriia bacterium SbA2]